MNFVAGFGIAFFYSWKLTLVMMSLTPFLALLGFFIAKVESAECGLCTYVLRKWLSELEIVTSASYGNPFFRFRYVMQSEMFLFQRKNARGKIRIPARIIQNSDVS